ncbi:hypothetical protein JCM9279_002214 [Rhodotorula babjevae]
MSSHRGYSPASAYGSTSPGSASSSSTGDRSDTASTGDVKGPQKKTVSWRTASCDACIKAKRACNLLAPCLSCETRDINCTYTAVNPEARFNRIIAIEAAEVERTIALRNLRNECDKLLLRIDELKTRLGLSDQELDALQQVANERMLADKPFFDMKQLSGDRSALLARAAPSARAGASRKTSPSQPSQPRSPSSALATTAASSSTSSQSTATSHQPHRPHKRARSDEAVSSVGEEGLERDGADSADEMPPPRAAPTRRQPLRASARRASLAASTAAPAAAPTVTSNALPLPPFDPSGRPYPAAAYHFPRTHPWPPQAPMPAPPVWMSPLLSTLYPVLPVPHGHRSWDAPRLAARGSSSPTSASLGLGLGVEESLRAYVGTTSSGRGGEAWSRGWGRRWAGPPLGGARQGTMFGTGSLT